MKKPKHSTSNIQHPTSNDEDAGVWEFNEGDANGRKFDLEERLLEFASAVIDLSEKLPSSRAGNHVANDLADADEPAALVVEVGSDGEEAGLGEPVGLVAMVLAHAEDVVQDDDAGDRAWGGRNGEPGGHLAARSRDEDVGHGRFTGLDGG